MKESFNILQDLGREINDDEEIGIYEIVNIP